MFVARSARPEVAAHGSARGPRGRARLSTRRDYAGDMGDGVAGPVSTPGPGPTAATTTIELLLGGMHCQSCAALVAETLTGDPAVREAVVDLDTARASVTYDPTAVTADQLCAAVAGAGYSATPATPGDGGA